MAELCREFGISRKTGYKIFDRNQECGIQGLTDGCLPHRRCTRCFLAVLLQKLACQGDRNHE